MSTRRSNSLLAADTGALDSSLLMVTPDQVGQRKIIDTATVRPSAPNPSSFGDCHHCGLGSFDRSGALGSGIPQTRPASSSIGLGSPLSVTITVTSASSRKARSCLL